MDALFRPSPSASLKAGGNPEGRATFAKVAAYRSSTLAIAMASARIYRPPDEDEAMPGRILIVRTPRLRDSTLEEALEIIGVLRRSSGCDTAHRDTHANRGNIETSSPTFGRPTILLWKGFGRSVKHPYSIMPAAASWTPALVVDIKGAAAWLNGNHFRTNLITDLAQRVRAGEELPKTGALHYQEQLVAIGRLSLFANYGPSRAKCKGWLESKHGGD